MRLLFHNSTGDCNFSILYKKERDIKNQWSAFRQKNPAGDYCSRCFSHVDAGIDTSLSNAYI